MPIASAHVPVPLLALSPIGLQELDAHAALQDRVDVKYIVTLAQLADLLERLAPTHRALDIDGLRAFSYRTTYYDTADMLTFREHVQQRRLRFKCRKRRYVDSERSVFEVKLKGPRGRTVKHSIACCPANELAAEEAAFLDARVLEAYGRRIDHPMTPTLTASCLRSTIVAPDLGERLTCDLELDFGGGARLAPQMAIVESKSLRGTASADRVLRAMGARPVERCSKYLLGMALTYTELPDNDLRALLRRYFVASASRPTTCTCTRVTSRT